MSTVCNWLNFFCLREVHKKKAVQHRIHPNRQAYDAVVTWNGKGKSNSLSFDIILEPATAKHPGRSSHRIITNQKRLSEENLDSKLKNAEKRRSFLEQERIQQLAKRQQKAQDAITKAQNDNLEFAKKTEEKLRRSFEKKQEKRDIQIKALQQRCRNHSAKVSEVQKSGMEMVRDFENKAERKLSNKMGTYEENRKHQLRTMLTKLQEHADHIKEVCVASESRSANSEELHVQLVNRMELALKNRGEQLACIQQKLTEHEEHIKNVQRKKCMLSSGGAEKIDV